MVMRPRRMPKVSCSTLAMGARQFVVHEAFETMSCFRGSYASWLTPQQIVKSASLDGAEMMTFFAPASRCLAALARSVKSPLHSSTSSTPSDFHGSLPGSRSASTRIILVPTAMRSSSARTCSRSAPWTESCFRRCASVFASVMSLTATKSSASSPRQARRTLRPMRPNPLMPTRILAMKPPPPRKSISLHSPAVKQRSVPAPRV